MPRPRCPGPAPQSVQSLVHPATGGPIVYTQPPSIWAPMRSLTKHHRHSYAPLHTSLSG